MNCRALAMLLPFLGLHIVSVTAAPLDEIVIKYDGDTEFKWEKKVGSGDYASDKGGERTYTLQGGQADFKIVPNDKITFNCHATGGSQPAASFKFISQYPYLEGREHDHARVWCPPGEAEKQAGWKDGVAVPALDSDLL
ncbi:uncharacterized protein I303_106245 [Kwoniella dejecticola CBS 10117]|uniref:Ig-like domain-containing protein n=1 Tax=Kwoniella dejecticola CBS 10117 TaxID=1296121 RepID=A0A1A6A1P1_9TREE|nr:uncharacterized protein I303_06264 [Kwoniella dejecticola CBS 10117]OBR83977.1 hypothetical protein I303_06264 [Kwoniella dejecticola CBS 10117]